MEGVEFLKIKTVYLDFRQNSGSMKKKVASEVVGNKKLYNFYTNKFFTYPQNLCANSTNQVFDFLFTCSTKNFFFTILCPKLNVIVLI